MLTWQHPCVVASLLGALIGASSCGGNTATDRPTSGSGGDSTAAAGTGTPGAGGTFTVPPTGTGGTGFIGAGGVGMSTPNDSGACQRFTKDLVPKIPTVFVLVDRSGSMFDPQPKTMSNSWEPLKAATLAVINGPAKVRYGFGAFTGVAGGACPDFNKVDIAADNYTPIKTLYDMLKKPEYKAETPTMKVLAMVGDLLKADPGDGSKNILFVTDGDPDYCDDGNPFCPVDSTVAVIQKLYKEGINTFVLGIQSGTTSASNDALQEFANAGLGQPVAPPGTLTPEGIYNQCNGVAGWKADATAAGTTMNQALGTYTKVGGTAPLYKPDGADQAALQNAIGSVVEGLKSCVLDLPTNFEVDLGNLAGAKVTINGKDVAPDPENGWRMNSKTQLEFVGAACELWKRPDSSKLDTQFPCVYDIAR